jgi:hypothetical protein
MLPYIAYMDPMGMDIHIKSLRVVLIASTPKINASKHPLLY